MATQGSIHPERVVEKTVNNIVVAFSDDFCAGVQRRSQEFNKRREEKAGCTAAPSSSAGRTGGK